MESLYNIVRESVLDDDFIDNDRRLISQMWANEHLDNGSYEVTSDGVIRFKDSNVLLIIENDDLPKGIRFDGNYYISLRSCTKIDMSAFGGTVLNIIFSNCDLKGFTGETLHLPIKYTFRNCVGNNTKWMGRECRGVNFEHCSGKWDFTKLDMASVIIHIYDSDCEVVAKQVHELRIAGSKLLDIFKNIDVDYRVLRIEDCKAIKNLKGINKDTQLVYINYCNNLESLEGLEDTSVYSLSFSECPQLDNSDYLPTTLQSIVAHGNYLCWTDDEIAQKYPYISSIKGTPLHKLDLTLGGKVKVGAYGAVRTAAHSHSLRYGSSRSSLVLDRVKKFGKTVIWEKCKSRSHEDFEMMDDDANPKKNWDYVDPNGFNDCTGVGIEVGDEVAVYCASGPHGRSNGVSRDVVLGFTPKMVKTKDNGNRLACDICILRPHHIAKDFFDK